MGYIRSSGVIIKEVNTGEADKVVTILSKTHGKISGYAKGARRPKSSLMAGMQFLCYSDLVMYKGKEMYSINTCDVIEPFYEIRNDIIKLTYCAHITDILNDVMQENQPAAKVLQLFLNTLHMLAKTDKPPELITRVFEIRFLSILGYAPFVSGCINCSTEEMKNISFSFKKCGFLCDKCCVNDISAMSISTGAAKALHHIVYAKMKDLFSFSLSPEVLNELDKVCRRYLRERLEKDYTKLDFLKNL